MTKANVVPNVLLVVLGVLAMGMSLAGTSPAARLLTAAGVLLVLVGLVNVIRTTHLR